ncbi:MAG: ornithine cyclodeaminase family protein [Bacteroidota bacterium]
MNQVPKIIQLPEIKNILKEAPIFEEIEKGFVAFSKGEAVIPPVGEMIFENPPGELHLKYGYLKSGAYAVVKIASGFYNNPQLGLSSSQGMMLLFDQRTGVIKGILLDHGYLTDVRTAVAGAIAAKYLAPKVVHNIGIVGTGIQGKFQLDYLRTVTGCRKVIVFARSNEKGQAYLEHFSGSDWQIEVTQDLKHLAISSQLIVTATPSKTPLIRAEWIQAGTHLTAVGSDTAEKIELDPAILQKANLVVVDSLSQSISRGEVYQAVKAKRLDRASVLELGQIIADPKIGRRQALQLTVADLTGVAVQDLMIAKAVFEGLREKWS